MLAAIFPTQYEVVKRLKITGMILLGALAISPLVARLPMVGWDWYYFFNQNNPTFNLVTSNSAYPPWDRYILAALTWMDWRTSLTLLNSLAIISIAIGTWQRNGRYGSIALALLSPPLWMLLWIGHPDGLVIFGLFTGLIPVALIKPQLSIWAYLGDRKGLVWAGAFILFTLLIWPLWPLRMLQATFQHEAAFGWAQTGWPVLALGLIMLLGAGRDPYRLIAAGLLINPHLMPYNLPVLLPIIGQAKGWRKIAIWGSTWLVPLGVGGMGHWKYLSLVFPIGAYLLTGSPATIWNKLSALLRRPITTMGRLLNRRPAAGGIEARERS